jgi:glycosyltransferase involved in cell wall biosynthesis
MPPAIVQREFPSDSPFLRDGMKNVLLVHERVVQHYRVPVYNYLCDYLRERQFVLTVLSEGIQDKHRHHIRFPFCQERLAFIPLMRRFIKMKPDVVLFWNNPHFYMFPILVVLKLSGIKIIHWGHRRPMGPTAFFKKIIINGEHWIDDGIILYAEQFREYVFRRFQSKTFVANNTLNLTEYKPAAVSREEIKQKYGIATRKNIVYMGRIQPRRHLEHLIQAYQMLDMEDIGLILVGTDDQGILSEFNGRNIYKLGPLFGEESLALLSASDVYCLPSSVGLSIVDAFYCGLPMVTENVVHGPEIMYLKEGVNGFMVPEGDILQLAAKLKLLLADDALRQRFSLAARQEIMTTGHIHRMCEGFLSALQYVCGQK